MIPNEIYYEIFQYLRPCERMILNEIESIKQYYQNFVKTIIWPKLFKGLIYGNPKCGIISNITFDLRSIEEKYHIIEDDYVRTYRYIDTFYSNTFCLFDYTSGKSITGKETIIELPFCENEKKNKVLSHFIILGKNITKIELRDCIGVVYHNFYLKKDIVKFKPPDICMPLINCIYPLTIKIYAESFNKIYSKEYVIEANVLNLLRFPYHLKIETYQRHKISKYLVCCQGTTVFCKTFSKSFIYEYPHGF